jgi:hypothetical protein
MSLTPLPPGGIAGAYRLAGGPMLGSPAMRIRGNVRVHTSAKGEAPAEREEPCDEDEFDSFGVRWLRVER